MRPIEEMKFEAQEASPATGCTQPVGGFSQALVDRVETKKSLSPLRKA
jgi:serine/threonine protein kinase